MAGIPSLTDEEILALAPQLVAAAATQSLTSGYKTRLDAVTAAERAFVAVRGNAAPVAIYDLNEIDDEADDLFRALHGLVEAFERVPDESVAKASSAIRGSLFPEGLRFITWSHTRQAIEGRRVITAAKATTYPAPYASAAHYLIGALETVQARYDVALTAKAIVVNDSGEARNEARAALYEALRAYARFVEGRADSRPAFAQALLAPVERLREANKAKRKASSPPKTPT